MVLAIQIAFAVLAFILVSVTAFAFILTLFVVLAEYFREKKIKKHSAKAEKKERN